MTMLDKAAGSTKQQTKHYFADRLSVKLLLKGLLLLYIRLACC